MPLTTEIHIVMICARREPVRSRAKHCHVMMKTVFHNLRLPTDKIFPSHHDCQNSWFIW